MLSPRQLIATSAAMVAALVAVGFALRSTSLAGSTSMAAGAILPDVVLWAWERPEDLRFLRSHKASVVAFLAKTILLPTSRGTASSQWPQQIAMRPRLQPLRVATGTPLIAVVRIETSAERGLAPASATSDEILERASSEIAELQNLPAVRGLQIDFDATSTQHDFYAALLQRVRSKLRAEMPLSISALASWCLGDPWLAQLPAGTIDEAIPMVFRMGRDTGNITRFLSAGGDFRVPACRLSLGIATDEPLSLKILRKQIAAPSVLRAKKRIYVFSPRPWTESSADQIFQEWQP